MAADLHIHIFEDIDESDIAHFFAHSLGSKHFNMGQPNCWNNNCYDKGPCGRVSGTPSVWIGEVSWLKAALFNDQDSFVPEPVSVINEIIGEDLPVLDEALKEKLLAALGQTNNTGYSLAGEREVAAFLDKHIGKRLFTISH